MSARLHGDGPSSAHPVVVTTIQEGVAILRPAGNEAFHGRPAPQPTRTPPTANWILRLDSLATFGSRHLSLSSMDILPVLDLLNGVIVRGVAGKREEYRPVVSRLADSPDGLSVARAFRDQLGLTRVYLADLDAILHQRPNRKTYEALAEDGFELLVDAGLRNIESAESVLAAGA